MKILILLPLLLCGCATSNMNKLVKALANDHSTVHVRVNTIYGTLDFTRTNPSTNSLPHSIDPDGRVQIGPK